MRATSLLAIALLASACGEVPSSSPSAGPTGCADDMAMIRVGDGFLQRVCGCAETDTSAVFPDDTFVCTVSAGNRVVFLYQGARFPHRIVPTGTPSFATGFVYDPKDENPFPLHEVIFEAAGSYLFEDEFLRDLDGEITVL